MLIVFVKKTLENLMHRTQKTMTSTKPIVPVLHFVCIPDNMQSINRALYINKSLTLYKEILRRKSHNAITNMCRYAVANLSPNRYSVSDCVSFVKKTLISAKITATVPQ